MEWYVVLIAGLTLLLGLFLSGAPIFIAFMIINVVGTLVYFGPAGFGMFANSLYDTTTFPTLIAVPLFILMGEFLFRSGTMDVLYNSLDKLVGRSRLRLYYLSIALATMFGALSGAAMGVVAMLGRSLFPGLIARGYDRQMSTGTILAGASLAPIIPPSILVIIIGSLAQVSIAKLLISGIIPGLILSGLFLVYIVLRVKLDPSRAPAVADDIGVVTWADRGIAVVKMIPFTIIILGVLGTIMAGIATPEESAGTGVLGTLIVAWIYGRLNFGLIREACDSTARITAMILAIMMSSKMFGQLLAFSGSTAALGRLHQRSRSQPLDPSVRPDGSSVPALPVHRPGGIDAGRYPDLHAAPAAARFRPDMVLAIVPDQHHAGRNHPTVRLHHVRLQGGAALRPDDGNLQRVMAVRVHFPDRDADLRRLPGRGDLAAQRALGAGAAVRNGCGPRCLLP